MIEVQWRCKLTAKAAGAAVTEDAARKLAKQVARDASDGTFAEMPKAWEALGLRDRAAPLADCVMKEARGDGVFDFTLQLSTELFPLEWGGMQHLVGVLAGDLFTLQTNDVRVGELHVTQVILPKEYQAQARELYRTNAHSIAEIRKLFSLGEFAPLVAWSIKPRTAVPSTTFRRAVLQAAEAGINIIEMDTRDILWSDARIEELVALAKEVAAPRKQVSRLSVNLPPDRGRLADFMPFLDPAKVGAAPHVLKVDGGLDGISICQALRNDDLLGPKKPVITCYPLLRDTLRPRVPSETFVDLLALSGADILYPGGRPTVDSEQRSLGTAAAGSTELARDGYRRHLHREYPMPTIAGGILPGQLHAYYELLGPNVAYFLGGAISLHEEGPQAGARLCRDIFDEAAKLRGRLGSAPPTSELSTGLVEQCDHKYPTENGSAYIAPGKYLKTIGVKSHFEDGR